MLKLVLVAGALVATAAIPLSPPAASGTTRPAAQAADCSTSVEYCQWRRSGQLDCKWCRGKGSLWKLHGCRKARHHDDWNWDWDRYRDRHDWDRH